MAPPAHRNRIEDRFWQVVDPWGADGLQILRRAGGPPPSPMQLERLAVWLLSLELRNPRKLAEIDEQAKRDVREIIDSMGYAAFRSAHHPDSLGEFLADLEQPGLTELGAKYLHELVPHREVRKRLMVMDWQVVTVTNSEPILTSDVPLIRYKGLEHDDGLWLLPLSNTEFLAIFNRGSIDMKRSIELNIRDGVFIEAMNKYVVRHKIDYVYGRDDSQMSFVSRHWAVAE